MGFSTEVRISTVDWLRTHIGDEDRLIFKTNEELDSLLRATAWPGRVTERLNAYLGNHYSNVPECVLDLTITAGGLDGRTYRIDENSKFVAVVIGVLPAENTSIEIQYLRIRFDIALSNALIIMATDQSKLAMVTNTGDVKLDMRETADRLMLQAQKIAVIGSWQ